MSHEHPRQPERPRAEPEIIPPEGGDAGARGIWLRIKDEEGVRRVFIARPGLPEILFGLLILGLIAAVAFVALASVVLVWIPLLILAVLLAFASGAIRRRWRQLRAWYAGAR
jgi:hypothetical protein